MARPRLFATLGVVVVLAPSASAQQGTAPARHHLAFGLGTAGAEFLDARQEDAYGQAIRRRASSGTQFTFQYGLRFNRNFEWSSSLLVPSNHAEERYGPAGTPESGWQTGFSGSYGSALFLTGFRGLLPLADGRVNPYLDAEFGYGVIDNGEISGTDSGFAWSVAAGVEYRFTRRLSARVEGRRSVINVTSTSVYWWRLPTTLHKPEYDGVCAAVVITWGG